MTQKQVDKWWAFGVKTIKRALKAGGVYDELYKFDVGGLCWLRSPLEIDGWGVKQGLGAIETWQCAKCNKKNLRGG